MVRRRRAAQTTITQRKGEEASMILLSWMSQAALQLTIHDLKWRSIGRERVVAG
jgi:hypothetical protein